MTPLHDGTASDFGAYESRHDIPALVCWLLVVAGLAYCAAHAFGVA